MPVPRPWAAKTTLCPLLPAQLANSCFHFKTHLIATCSARSFLAFPSHVPCGSHRAHLTCSPLQPSCQQSRPPGPRQQHSRSACVQSCSYPAPIQCMTPSALRQSCRSQVEILHAQRHASACHGPQDPQRSGPRNTLQLLPATLTCL